MALLPFSPKRARFADIILAMKARLLALNVVPPTLVQITASNDPPTVNAQKLIYLRARRYMGAQSQIESAGRLDTRLSRQVDVYLSNRVSLDTVNSDETWLTAAGRSYFDLEEEALNALHGYWPVDSDGNALTIDEIRIVSGADPDKDAVRLGWGRASMTMSVDYMPPLSLADISPDTIPAGVAGTAYSQAFTQTGVEGMTAIANAAWTIATGGALPGGLTVNSASGTVSGTPTTAGNFQFVLTVTDGAPTSTGISGYHRYYLAVAIGITGTLPGGTHNVVYGPQTLTAVGATGAVTWSIFANSGAFNGTLPAGLTLNATTGVVSGTPTTAGTSAFTVLATDAHGNTGTQTFTVIIA